MMFNKLTELLSTTSNKGGLILESFLLWLHNLQNKLRNHSLDHHLFSLGG